MCQAVPKQIEQSNLLSIRGTRGQQQVLFCLWNVEQCQAGICERTGGTLETTRRRGGALAKGTLLVTGLVTDAILILFSFLQLVVWTKRRNFKGLKTLRDKLICPQGKPMILEK